MLTPNERHAVLTPNERFTLAAALALALEFGEHTPDVGITDWNDRDHVLSVCFDIVDRMPAARARLPLLSLHAALLPEPRNEDQRVAQMLVASMIELYFGGKSDTAPRQPMIAVLTTPGIGQVSGMLVDPPKLEQRPDGALHTDVGHDSEGPDYDPERLGRVHEVLHLRTHDIVILVCEREVIVMTTAEFHSQV